MTVTAEQSCDGRAEVMVVIDDIDGGTIRLILDDATASSATPAPGAAFIVDATAQQAPGDALLLDGSKVLATALALLGGAGADGLAGGGGADRLEVVADMAADGLTPSPETVAAIAAPLAIASRMTSGRASV